MYNVLVIGGAKGLGLGIVKFYLKKEDCLKIYVLDKDEIKIESDKIIFFKANLVDFDLCVLDEFKDISKLYVTAGLGKVSKFENIDDVEIKNTLRVNVESILRILRYFYKNINSNENFKSCVLCSISGHVVSPLMSLYSASKAGLTKFIQAINIELEKSNSVNRILEVSPGFIEGTSFYGEQTETYKFENFVEEIITKSDNNELLFIPQYDDVYKSVIERNNMDYFRFGCESYDFKITSNRINNNRQYILGYLSGTFDLFHIGHLNLLKRAKEYCDFLIVGVHKDAYHKGKSVFICFEERMAILKSVKYVDKVVAACEEDDDAFNLYHYDFLFVGSDYKGSDRFNRYEKKFSESNVKIIYFPYTLGTSSTQLRQLIDSKNMNNSK